MANLSVQENSVCVFGSISDTLPVTSGASVFKSILFVTYINGTIKVPLTAEKMYRPPLFAGNILLYRPFCGTVDCADTDSLCSWTNDNLLDFNAV